MADEYSLVDEVHLLAGLLDTFGIVYPQLQDIDLRVDAVRLDVPIYVVEGGNEVRGRTEPAHEWFGTLEVPHKEMVVFDAAGHRPLFIEFMTGTLLADTTTVAP